MFGNRRRRAASNPPLNGSNASQAAMTAAASVFLKNQASNASLSSAAAAAALRSRPTTPISVADVQTKRTLRRSGSASSMGSSLGGSQRGNGRPSLERRGSSGSMTERTFRDQSPARGVPSAPDAPPVPSIPQKLQSKAHRRATSLEAPPMRVASPPPNQSTGRGSSLGPGTTAAPRRAAQRMSNLSSVSELTGADSRGSVNFSYPTNSRPQSPITQRRLTSPSLSRNNPRITSPANQNLVYDPNTRSFLPAVEVHAIEQRIYDAANKPVKKKKRTPPGNATGSHLAEGTVGGRLKGSAIDEMEAAAKSQPVPQQPVEQAPVRQPKSTPAPVHELSADSTPSPTSLPRRKKKKQVVHSDSDSDQASYAPNSSDNDSDFPPFNTRTGTLLAKKPSIVREDREREEQEDDTPKRDKPSSLMLDTSPVGRDISPSPLPKSTAGRGHGKGQGPASTVFAQEIQQIRSASQPAPAQQSPVTPGLTANGSVKGTRVQSVSPGRSAHFASSPDNLIVKHQPPPRSISPRKSALKHSNSRGSSPVPGAGVELSNGSAVPEEQLSAPRKKSVRVSFDESNVVVGQAATPVTSESPIVQSPQAGKRPWYSIGRGNKKGSSIASDEEDEFMKPRPALPSFGSVRERKNRDVEERVLVRPADPIETRPEPIPLFTSPTGEVLENPLGQSNDHAVGAILSHDSTTKNAANISKSREPLPPQVTSVEGSGYNSDTDSSAAEMDPTPPSTAVTEPEIPKEPLPIQEVQLEKTISNEPSDRDTPTPTQDRIANGNVPQIEILQATPTLQDTTTQQGWPSIPGGWESSTSDSGSVDTPRASTEALVESTPAAVGIAEPTPEVQVHASPKIEVEHIQSTPAIMEETDESEADVYSDAAEEMTDGEGEVFQSLNAVVESPIHNSTPGLAISTPPDSPTVILGREKAYKQSILSRKSSEPDIDEGWDKAQEYWKGLSVDKKRQLELEAMREAEDGSDTEVEAKPAPKPKRKKKVVKPAVEPINTLNERTYMIQPGSKAGPSGHTTMRSSMRVEPTPAPDNTMRKSMRSQEPGVGHGTLRGSMRDSQKPEPRGSFQKKNRPVSLPVQSNNVTVGNKHARNLSSASAAAASDAARRDMQPVAPKLRRRGSGNSDSSFKRERPAGNGMMRRSMRGNNTQDTTERPQSPSSRFNIRSLSPTGSMIRRPFNSTPVQQNESTHMRMSMRGSQGATPSLRGSAPGRAKSPSGGMKMPGFGRSSKPAKTQKSTQSRASRFADSSDEEEDRPAFRSRFMDSSDDSDDEPVRKPTAMPRSMRSSAPAATTTSTPVRGIPKRTGVDDGDSSDLSDSDDEKPTSPGLKLKKRTQNGTPATNGAQGATLASGSLRRSGSGRETLSSPPITTETPRPTQKRRGSFMSILRRKKDNTSKVRKSDAESPARRDTPLERSKSDLLALRSSNERPMSPKLQKRNNPLSRENSSQWPLKAGDSPAKIMGGEDGRPFTADAGDGVVGAEATGITTGGATNGVIANGVDSERPDIGNRRFTATGLGGAVDSKGVIGVGVGPEGRKKKKFGALRRMFRLDD